MPNVSTFHLNLIFNLERKKGPWKKREQKYGIASLCPGWAFALGNDLCNFLSWIILPPLNQLIFHTLHEKMHIKK